MFVSDLLDAQGGAVGFKEFDFPLQSYVNCSCYTYCAHRAVQTGFKEFLFSLRSYVDRSCFTHCAHRVMHVQFKE